MVCMCVKRDAKEAESRAGRGERCRPRIRLRGDSVWMAVVRNGHGSVHFQNVALARLACEREAFSILKQDGRPPRY